MSLLTIMKNYLLPSLKLTAILIILCSGIYPLLIALIAKASPGGGNGVTVTANGRVVGYENIGQKFTGDEWFHGRPSAVYYNAAGSGGSNKGPSDAGYLATVQARIDTFLAHNPTVQRSEIPAALVTASGSGLDPHIPVKAAEIQVARIAKARHRNEKEIHNLIEQLKETSLFGPDKINVLKLNIELNKEMSLQ